MKLFFIILFFPLFLFGQTYIQGNNLIQVPASTATAAGTTTLTASSQTNQEFTGSTTQTVVLPNATTLQKGRSFYITNRSSGVVTVNYNGGSLARTLFSQDEAEFLVEDNSTSAGVWDINAAKLLAPAASNAVMLAEGSNVATTITGSQYQSLIANASGDPSFQALNLAQGAAVSGILGTSHGGTGQNALGNLTDVGTDGITVTGGTGAVIINASLSQHVADTTHNGYLSSTDWNTFNGKQVAGNYITALTGDGTASGPGSAALTLATVNSNVGSFGSSTAIPSFTVNGKGLITAASTTAVIAPAGTLTGTTLASNVVSSSLTGVGTIGTGIWQGTAISPTYGGTGQNTSATTGYPLVTSGVWSFNNTATTFGALSPLTTKGDILIYSTINDRQAVPGDYGKLIPDSAQTNGWRSAGYSNIQDGRPGKNYVQYADFENGATTGWSLGTTGTLTSGLPTGTPTFGSGASGNLSISASSSSPIAGSYMLAYASSTATTQGNMVATSSLPLDPGDRGKNLSIRFSYTTVSGGGNVNYTATSSGSYAWAIWDVTNSAWLATSGVNFCFNQSSGVGYCTGTALALSTTANIRFVFYNMSATAGAATVGLDDFWIGYNHAIAGRYFNSASSISGSLGTITYSTKSRDTNSAYSGGTLTIPEQGMYHFDSKIVVSDASGTHTIYLAIYQNGTEIAANTVAGIASATPGDVEVNDTFYCNQNDTIVVKASDSGTTPAIANNTSRNFFSWVRVSD